MTTDLLIEFAWKSAALTGGTLIALRLLRRRSAAERSFVAHAGLLAALFLPLAVLRLPALTVELPAAPTFGQARLSPPTEVHGPPGSKGASIPLGDATQRSAPVASGQGAIWLLAYALPAAVLALLTLLAVARLFTLRARASVLVDGPWLTALARAQQRMGFKDGTALLVSEDVRSPVSWGLMRPVILLDPRAVEAREEAEAIIAHELAHVARLDWANMLIARLVTALFWFNPFAWRLAAEAHQLREEAADDAVLRADVDGADYASLLVGAARHENRSLALAAHGVAPGRNSLKRRVARVLDARLSRVPARGVWTAGCSALVVLVVGPLAALSPVEAQSVAAGRDATATSLRSVREPAQAEADAEARPDRIERTSRQRRPSVEQLIEMRMFDVTPEYADEIAAAEPAFADLGTDDLIEFRMHGVDGDFLRELKRAGIAIDDPSDVAPAAIQGVDAAFVREMAEVGFEGLSLEDLTDLRIAGVSADYVRSFREAGYRDLTVDEVTELALFGIDLDDLKRGESR
ncbi:M56 family metallopeptidase [Parvularcula dongshanensis]|uniref:Beta-lactamase regulating signal transducer with metallopeptidase domain n=1 Tax=Parvularcula dongshanensis TaxID=1173995 RepID=A0A840I5N4_9PROT|nr:M56 family metallopeptidase [Parvularcula dongshanensis]MBB4659583.1 beta-lactamase regulating signal transducer with metallopeptidase domain [Parvularcula dongshanensis]